MWKKVLPFLVASIVAALLMLLSLNFVRTEWPWGGVILALIAGAMWRAFRPRIGVFVLFGTVLTYFGLYGPSLDGFTALILVAGLGAWGALAAQPLMERQLHTA